MKTPNQLPPSYLEKVLGVIIGFIAALVFIASFTFALCAAWNYLAVSLFHLPTVRFWQVFAIIFIAGQIKRLLR